MFGTTPNPSKAYASLNLETSVQTASPHRLIVLLFEGACEAVKIARIAMEEKDISKKGASIAKAMDIILNGLRAAVNLEEGGEIANNLFALYDYMGARLLHANVHDDPGALDEVIDLLVQLQEAWVSIGDEVAGGAAGSAD